MWFYTALLSTLSLLMRTSAYTEMLKWASGQESLPSSQVAGTWLNLFLLISTCLLSLAFIVEGSWTWVSLHVYWHKSILKNNIVYQKKMVDTRSIRHLCKIWNENIKVIYRCRTRMQVFSPIQSQRILMKPFLTKQCKVKSTYTFWKFVLLHFTFRKDLY